MKSGFFRAGALLCGLLSAACAADSPDTEAVDNTTAELLAQPVTDGVSTAIAVDPTLVQEGPPVEVAELGFDLGDGEAIVKVVELSDFGCSYCKRFHDESFPALREEFIQTGKVEWKFVPYITGLFPNSLAATEAGECVMEQSAAAYEAISRRMWTEQSNWKGTNRPEPLLRGWVSELDIDMGDFDSCLTEDRRLSRIVSATTLARQVGVRGTPTFVIIGYPPLQGALPLDFFRDVLTRVHTQEARQREEARDTGK